MEQLPDGSYYILDIKQLKIISLQLYICNYIIKEDETVPEKLPRRIYVNKIKNKVTFKIETKYYLEILVRILFLNF